MLYTTFKFGWGPLENGWSLAVVGVASVLFAQQLDGGGGAGDRCAAAGAVSHLPRGDWRIGAPFYLCAALQCAALALAWIHFRGLRRARLASQAAASSV